MATAADKKRWDTLHAAYAKAADAEKAYESALGAKYGHHFDRTWLTSAQREKLDKLRGRKNKVGEKIIDLIVKVSPRGDSWLHGVPSFWLREKLTWEDVIRPKNEPLSVVVPGAYGYPDGYMKAKRPMARNRVMSRRQPSLPGFPDYPDELEIEIPNMPWTQIGGDQDPGAYGGLIATADGDHIELLEIQPVREYVGDSEAADVGFPFWTKEAWFDLADLDPKSEEVQSALQSSGFDSGEQKDWFEEEASPTERALVIAEALVRYGRSDEGPSGWSEDLPDIEVKWSAGKTVNMREYLADEDDEFRREVLGEEDEEEEEDEESEEEPSADELPTAENILRDIGPYLTHEGHDAEKESKAIAKLIAKAKSEDEVDEALERINELIDGHGVEAISGDYSVDNYYHDTVALYVNMGDSYVATILYETEEERFLVTSWGEWVERNQDKYKIR